MSDYRGFTVLENVATTTVHKFHEWAAFGDVRMHALYANMYVSMTSTYLHENHWETKKIVHITTTLKTK